MKYLPFLIYVSCFHFHLLSKHTGNVWTIKFRSPCTVVHLWITCVICLMMKYTFIILYRYYIKLRTKNNIQIYTKKNKCEISLQIIPQSWCSRVEPTSHVKRNSSIAKCNHPLPTPQKKPATHGERSPRRSKCYRKGVRL